MIHGVSTRIAIVCSLLVLLSLEHGGCAQNATLPVWSDLRNALIEIAKQNNSGFGNNVWAVTVNNYGEIDQVVYTGAKVSDQWFASRTIAAMKAFTAFSLSSDSFAISTANVYGLSQPNGTLYGIQSTSPIDTQAAYKGCRERFGTERDPLRGQMIGGITVIAGGLALYDSNGTLIGGLGVSGDTACTDHIIAWKLRHRLQFDFVSNGFGGNGNSSNSNSSSNGSGQTETTQCSILGNLTNGNSVDLQCSAVNFTFFNCEVTTTSSSSSSGSSPTVQNNTIEINCPSQTSSDVTIDEQPIIADSSSSQSVPVRVSRSSSSSVLPSNTNSASSNGQYDNLVHGSGSCALCYPVCDQAASEMLSQLLSDAPVSSR